MLGNLPRRKRGLLITSILGGSFIVIAVGLYLLLKPSPDTYHPADEVAGLTATLNRDVPDGAPVVEFVNATIEAGIDFVHFSGRRTSQIPEDMGSGAAWGDYDNDGWQDLYVVNIAGPITLSDPEVLDSPAHNSLYHNNGDGTFTEVSREAGVDARGWGSAAAWGDYDRDGRIDLIVTFYGTNILYRNNGDGTFSEATAKAGIGGVEGFWTGVSWSDYNRDGWLDFYVTGYLKYESDARKSRSLQYQIESPASINPSSFDPERNLLYRNNGDGTFSEVSAKAGVANLNGRSLAAAWADFDEDGWPDLYVANDVSDNVLYRNFGDGSFDDVSLMAAVADYRGAMGLAVGDWDGDLDLDLFVTHWLAQENALYSSQLSSPSEKKTDSGRPLRFRDVADRYGLGQIALNLVGWGTSFFDYDNDGRLDLLVVNGNTLEDRDAPRKLIGMRDILFWNGGAEKGFFDVSSIAGSYFEEELVGRGAAFADYDNDGDVDVFIVNHSGPGVLLRNESETGNSWLEIGLKGSKSNTRGVGAVIRVTTPEMALIRELGSQPSYLSQNSSVVHFGLGAAERIDSLEVRWPSGRITTLTDVDPNQKILIDEKKSAQ
jgi:enediyne biosynthesis protein E4